MDTRQAILQIRKVLRALVWPGTATLVFSSGLVLVGKEAARALTRISLNVDPGLGLVSPTFAQIWPGAAAIVREKPGLLDQDIVVRLGVLHAEDLTGDPFRELATAGYSKSGFEFPGLLHVEDDCRSSISRLGADYGFRIQFVASNAQQIRSQGKGTTRDLVFKAMVTANPDYPGPTKLAKQSLGGGIARLTWRAPYTGRGQVRWDLLGYTITYNQSSTIPSTPGVGLATVDIAGAVETVDITFVSTPGSYSARFWARYDEFPTDGTVDVYSTDSSTLQNFVVS